MTEQISEIWPQQWGPWESYRRPSVIDFVKMALVYLQPVSQARDCLQNAYELLQARDCLQNAYELLQEWQVIRLEQCNEFIVLIKAMEKPVVEYATFMDLKSQMPLMFFSLRYPVVAELAYTKEHIWMTLALLGRYRSLCYQSSSQHETASLYIQILKRLEKLLQGSEQVVSLSQVMFDQARFQERKDATAFSIASSPKPGENECEVKIFTLNFES